MTAQLSREEVITSEIADFFAGFVEVHTELGGPNTVEEAQAQLTERVLAALAGMDSEPVAKVDNIGVCWYADDGISRKPAVGSPLYAAPPAPVAVPDKWPEKLTWSHHDDMTQAEVLAWNNAIDACRAAMLKEDKS